MIQAGHYGCEGGAGDETITTAHLSPCFSLALSLKDEGADKMDAIAKQDFSKMFGVVRSAVAERKEKAFRSGGLLIEPLLKKALQSPVATPAKKTK